jgi:FkbM family methyltransferase
MIKKLKFFNLKTIKFLGIYNYIKLLLISILGFRKLIKEKFYLTFNIKKDSFLVSSDISDIYVLFEIFGQEEYVDIKKFSLKEVNVVDIGANIGMFYKYIKYLGIEIINYVGVEPNLKNYKTLIFNTYSDKSKIISKALWNDNKGVYLSEEFSTSTKIIQSGQNLIPSITLEALHNEIKIENFTGLNLLKMDIEGAEYTIIENNFKEIDENYDYLIIEFHNIDKSGVEKIFKKYLPKYAAVHIPKDNKYLISFAKKYN